MTNVAVEAMARRNIDIRDHMARQLEEKDISEADVVLCTSEEHCSTVRSLTPEAHDKTFTLPDFVTRAEGSPKRKGDEAGADWVARIAKTPQRDFSEIEDPPRAETEDAYERTAQRMEVMLHRLARALVAPPENA